jgi:hypothetical protein
MQHDEVIIFGNSPFLNAVDVEALLPTRTTVGINRFGLHHEVSVSFVYDGFISGLKRVYIPNWMSGEGTRYVPRASRGPIYPAQYQGAHPVYGFRYFTVSVALNWAICQGAKRIYLIGIDHSHTGKLPYWDGYLGECKIEVKETANQRLKEYVRNCTPYAEIYQCNPDVVDAWGLPYKDWRELLCSKSKP